MPDEPVRGTQETGALSRTAPPGGTAGDGKGVERTERAADLGLHTLRPRWRTRRIVFIVLASVVLLLIGAGMAYWRLNAGLVKTDNAQTGGDLAPVSAQISGIVTRIDVTDNQYVKSGTVLVELDPTDYRLALDQAKANLAAAEAQVRVAEATLADQENQYRTGVNAARGALAATTPRLPQAQAQVRMDEQTTAAQVAQAQAGVATARANVLAAQTTEETARKTLDRDRQLLTQGAIAQQQVDTDTAAFAGAAAQYRAAQEGLRQAQAALAVAEANREQVVIAQHTVAVNEGQIAQAQAQFQQAQAGDTLVRERAQQLAAAEAQAAATAQAVKTAQVNLDRTLIRAPADGWVTNRTAQIGQTVQPNQPLLSVAIAEHRWIVANIKETQLANVRVGDPARITVDVFRGRVFHGHVLSITAASGSATALLPPDNATGNFVKVVQLVAVRISLDPDSDPNVHVPVGVSAEVTIDTRHRGR